MARGIVVVGLGEVGGEEEDASEVCVCRVGFCLNLTPARQKRERSDCLGTTKVVWPHNVYYVS